MSEVVYFLHAGEAVKVGFTKNFEARLRALQGGSANTLEVIATLPGSRRNEIAVHDELSEYRLEGEWFENCAFVRDAIARYVTNGMPSRATRGNSVGVSKGQYVPLRDLENGRLLVHKLRYLDAKGEFIRAEIMLREAVSDIAEQRVRRGEDNDDLPFFDPDAFKTNAAAKSLLAQDSPENTAFLQSSKGEVR